jgi:hypothetical protein
MLPDCATTSTTREQRAPTMAVAHDASWRARPTFSNIQVRPLPVLALTRQTQTSAPSRKTSLTTDRPLGWAGPRSIGWADHLRLAAVTVENGASSSTACDSPKETR